MVLEILRNFNIVRVTVHKFKGSENGVTNALEDNILELAGICLWRYLSELRIQVLNLNHKLRGMHHGLQKEWDICYLLVTKYVFVFL